MGDSLVAILIVVLVIALIAIGPLLLLWSFNTLGIGQITYSFWQWLAALVIIGLLGSKARVEKS